MQLSILSSYRLQAGSLCRLLPRGRLISATPRLLKAVATPHDEAGMAGNPSVHSSTLELLNNAQKFILKSLDQAEDELEAYCSMLSDDESANKCWDAYEYLENKRKEAEEGCAWELVDGGRPGPHCARLQALEQMSYELIGSGEVSGIVSALATLSRAEKRSAERNTVREGEAVAFLDEEDITVVHPHGNQELESTLPTHRDYLRSLFSQLDRNRDGRIDMEELRAAMRVLGDELDGRMVALIGEAMDAHGHLDEDQFIQVVEAEEDMLPHDRLAKMWRQHHPSSRWWGEERHSKWGSPLEP